MKNKRPGPAFCGSRGVFVTICKINPAPGPKMQDFTCGFSKKTV